jgi:hypothetical protein
LLVAGQHDRIELDVQALAAERVVDRVAGESGLPVPQLDQFIDMGFQHVVAKHPAKRGNELLPAFRFKQVQGLAVDPDDPDLRAAALHPREVGQQESTQVADTFGAPCLQLPPHAAVILQPQRYRGEVEHVDIVAFRCRRGCWLLCWICHGLRIVFCDI